MLWEILKCAQAPDYRNLKKRRTARGMAPGSSLHAHDLLPAMLPLLDGDERVLRFLKGPLPFHDVRQLAALKKMGPGVRGGGWGESGRGDPISSPRRS